LSYPPYGGVLERALREGLSVIDGPWVERVWQVEMRLGQPRNRVEEARTFFFKLAEEAGLGIFRRGVRGQPSRLVLAPDLEERVRALRPLLVEGRSEISEGETREAAEPERAASGSESERTARAFEQLSVGVGGVAVTVTVTVDLTAWDLEKIEGFLRLLGVMPVRDEP